MVFVETHTPKFRLLEYCKLVMKVYKSSYFGKHLQASDKVVPVLGKIVVPWGSVFRKSRAFSKNA
jgi:hypothetical protein